MIFGLGATFVDQTEPSVPTEGPRSGREQESEAVNQSLAAITERIFNTQEIFMKTRRHCT